MLHAGSFSDKDKDSQWFYTPHYIETLIHTKTAKKALKHPFLHIVLLYVPPKWFYCLGEFYVVMFLFMYIVVPR